MDIVLVLAITALIVSVYKQVNDFAERRESKIRFRKKLLALDTRRRTITEEEAAAMKELYGRQDFHAGMSAYPRSGAFSKADPDPMDDSGGTAYFLRDLEIAPFPDMERHFREDDNFSEVVILPDMRGYILSLNGTFSVLEEPAAAARPEKLKKAIPLSRDANTVFLDEDPDQSLSTSERYILPDYGIIPAAVVALMAVAVPKLDRGILYYTAIPLMAVIVLLLLSGVYPRIKLSEKIYILSGVVYKNYNDELVLGKFILRFPLNDLNSLPLGEPLTIRGFFPHGRDEPYFTILAVYRDGLPLYSLSAELRNRPPRYRRNCIPVVVILTAAAIVQGAVYHPFSHIKRIITYERNKTKPVVFENFSDFYAEDFSPGREVYLEQVRLVPILELSPEGRYRGFRYLDCSIAMVPEDFSGSLDFSESRTLAAKTADFLFCKEFRYIRAMDAVQRRNFDAIPAILSGEYVNTIENFNEAFPESEYFHNLCDSIRTVLDRAAPYLEDRYFYNIYQIWEEGLTDITIRNGLHLPEYHDTYLESPESLPENIRDFYTAAKTYRSSLSFGLTDTFHSRIDLFLSDIQLAIMNDVVYQIKTAVEPYGYINLVYRWGVPQ
ncbi:hypothetical protein [Breznakiella homolactica]|uniref:Uncharacterized protein n=1 Tax=Breznakiella homolactica TaxID=2798577 RepID=A0A7T7XKU3_9SPIR|nr:hypothetical protein [Breznakiella homolactica]QQO08265.1 hypothetical protein JFL75_15180 [Breznakiella homolactica]